MRTESDAFFNKYTVQLFDLSPKHTRDLPGERFHSKNSITLTLIDISIDEFSVN